MVEGVLTLGSSMHFFTTVVLGYLVHCFGSFGYSTLFAATRHAGCATWDILLLFGFGTLGATYGTLWTLVVLLDSGVVFFIGHLPHNVRRLFVAVPRKT
jgi:hypothetical protein